MDLMNFGIEQFNNARFDPSFVAGSLSRTNPGAQDFKDLLEKARQNEDSQNTQSRRVTDIDKNDQLYQLCLELETFLVKNLLGSMRNTVHKSGLIEQGFAGKIYEDMLYDEYAKDLTRNAGFGLAEQAYRQLKHLHG